MRQQFHMSTATTSFSKSKSVMDVSANLGHRIWFATAQAASVFTYFIMWLTSATMRSDATATRLRLWALCLQRADVQETQAEQSPARRGLIQ